MKQLRKSINYIDELNDYIKETNFNDFKNNIKLYMQTHLFNGNININIFYGKPSQSENVQILRKSYPEKSSFGKDLFNELKSNAEKFGLKLSQRNMDFFLEDYGETAYELKKCNCGGNVKIKKHENNGGMCGSWSSDYWIRCEKCRYESKKFNDYAKDARLELIGKWNSGLI